jgi:TnpA family transposase
LSDPVLSARAQKISQRAYWLSDPDLRQHGHAGLNKGEAVNSVRRAVFFHRQGEIRDRPDQQARHQSDNRPERKRSPGTRHRFAQG